jgi:hypothetical protein
MSLNFVKAANPTKVDMIFLTRYEAKKGENLTLYTSPAQFTNYLWKLQAGDVKGQLFAFNSL